MKLLVLTLSVLALIAAHHPRANAATLAEQYAALLEEFNSPSGGMRQATTDAQRKAAVERLRTFAPRFLDLAEKNPNDPIALQALRQAVQCTASTDSATQIAWETNESDFPADITDDSARRIVDRLLRDHLLSDQLGPVCDRIRFGYRMEYESFLSAVLDKNPDRNVQATACVALAQFLNDRLSMLELVEDRPELARRYEAVFGPEYLPALRRVGRAQLTRRVEQLLERAVRDYSDVTLGSTTAGAIAESGLFDLRHLAVGNVAPDIEGRDADNTPFQLSDYRGKVVLLYFWSEY